MHPADNQAPDGDFPARIILADYPEWWFRLTGFYATSWRRELGFLVALPVVGLIAGLLIGLSLR